MTTTKKKGQVVGFIGKAPETFADLVQIVTGNPLRFRRPTPEEMKLVCEKLRKQNKRYRKLEAAVAESQALIATATAYKAKSKKDKAGTYVVQSTLQVLLEQVCVKWEMEYLAWQEQYV